MNDPELAVWNIIVARIAPLLPPAQADLIATLIVKDLRAAIAELEVFRALKPANDLLN